MKIEIVRERRKTLSLKVLDSQNAVLKAPKNLSEKKIVAFLTSKKNWLEKALLNMEKAEIFSRNYDLEKFVYFNGRPFEETKNIALGFDNLSESKKRDAVKKFYLSHFENLRALTQQIAKATGLDFLEVKPTNSVRLWGSFNTSGVMKLNWKLLILPQNLAEYVVIHELCHGRHMNHSPKFWKLVEKYCPDFKARKKELSLYGFLLKADVI